MQWWYVWSVNHVSFDSYFLVGLLFDFKDSWFLSWSFFDLFELLFCLFEFFFWYSVFMNAFLLYVIQSNFYLKLVNRFLISGIAVWLQNFWLIFAAYKSRLRVRWFRNVSVEIGIQCGSSVNWHFGALVVFPQVMSPETPLCT